MNVQLLDRTGLRAAAIAAKTCIGRADDGRDMNAGDVAGYLKGLIRQGHESVLEHVVYVFEVQGLSRACLQQLARHRHISLSVKSTRWALDKHGDHYEPPEINNMQDAATFDQYADAGIDAAMEMKRLYGNDVAKYILPECVTTDLILTLNLRELRHIYKLRTGKTAMLEFQHLAKALVACLPEDEQELVRYRSDALERAVQEFFEKGTEEARERLERMVE